MKTPGKAGEEERYSMSRMDRHRITRKLASIGLAMAVTMSLMPVSVGSAYAEDGTTEYLAAAQDDVIAEDVSAAEASLDLEETLTAEPAEDIETTYTDIETEGFAASDVEVLVPEDLLRDTRTVYCGIPGLQEAVLRFLGNAVT